MTHSIITGALSAFVLAASAVTAAPASAASLDEPVTITVSYRDLDISHPAGATVLLHRLEAAATKTCGGKPDVRVLEEVAAFDKCRDAAINRAVAAIDAPLLTAAANRSQPTVRVAGR